MESGGRLLQYCVFLILCAYRHHIWMITLHKRGIQKQFYNE